MLKDRRPFRSRMIGIRGWSCVSCLSGCWIMWIGLKTGRLGRLRCMMDVWSDGHGTQESPQRGVTTKAKIKRATSFRYLTSYPCLSTTPSSAFKKQSFYWTSTRHRHHRAPKLTPSFHPLHIQQSPLRSSHKLPTHAHPNPQSSSHTSHIPPRTPP